jgi:hypothetical protein
MTLAASDILTATLQFAVWQFAFLAASIPLARALGFGRFRRAEEQLLAVLALDVTLEASCAGLFSFLGINGTTLYWAAVAFCLLASIPARATLRQFWRTLSRLEIFRYPRTSGVGLSLLVPLFFLAFRPVEEIDSVNYLHYLIEWMANRATPYTFATNYVAFWELSFLPTWMVTRVDLFFPLLALKAVVLLALAAWLAGRELGLRRWLLLWAVFGAITLRHMWFEFSGVPTLKNDVLHGVGFVLLLLVAMRSVRRKLARADIALLAFGCAFAAVKYTGIFAAGLAIAIVLYHQRAWLSVAAAAVFTLLTSGHYYLHNALQYGSPFYPFQISFAFIHLPGTADLSATSILYSLRNPLTWRLLFLPSNGLSPAGLMFPITLVATLSIGAWTLLRPPSPAHRWAALLLLAGWFLYFRSVFSASAYAGDLVFLRSSLNTIRYVDGVLALSELFLVSLLARWPRLAGFLVVANLLSRLLILYPKLNAAVFAPRIVVASAVSVLLISLATADWRRRHAAIGLLAASLCLLAACPILVQRNRMLWTTYWNDLKPRLDTVRPSGLVHLALPDGGYFAGHVVAAGNPVDVRVRSLLPEELTPIPTGARPRFVTVLITPGSTPQMPPVEEWGYRPMIRSADGAIYEIK